MRIIHEILRQLQHRTGEVCENEVRGACRSVTAGHNVTGVPLCVYWLYECIYVKRDALHCAVVLQKGLAKKCWSLSMRFNLGSRNSGSSGRIRSLRKIVKNNSSIVSTNYLIDSLYLYIPFHTSCRNMCLKLMFVFVTLE